jgi:hypothetical protein
MSNVTITMTDVDAMIAILNSGDRAGAYLYYYNLIKDVDREAANQILMQMQITTYSGFFGGAALIGNAIAKDSNPDLYPETLDQFSDEIGRGLLSTIAFQIGEGSSGVLTADDIQTADRGVWNSYQIGHYLPGNIQFSMDGPTFYSEGTLAAMLAVSWPKL